MFGMFFLGFTTAARVCLSFLCLRFFRVCMRQLQPIPANGLCLYTQLCYPRTFIHMKTKKRKILRLTPGVRVCTGPCIYVRRGIQDAPPR